MNNFFLFQKNDKSEERLKKLDFNKLIYATAVSCQNQQLQYYFAIELPKLLHVKDVSIETYVFVHNYVINSTFD
jgi:ABC-type uncharacterized transport system substrate-binding protein